MTTTNATKLQGLAAFVHTVETGSFTAASERMGLSRSAAAKSVARLEARLGVQLLMRTTRAMALTREGEAFFERCVRVLDELDDAEAALMAQRRTIQGVLRVNLPLSFGRLWILPTLAELARQHPQLKLELSFTDRYVDLIEEGIDLAVRLGREEPSSSLIARRIAVQTSMTCASPEYLQARGIPQTLDDLQHHECIAFEQGGRALPWRVKNEDGHTVDWPVNGQMAIGHGEAMLDAAIAGRGLARLPDWLAGHYIRAGALVRVLPGADGRDEPIRAVWPERRDRSLKLRTAIDALVANLGPTPPWRAGDLPTEGSAQELPGAS